MFKPRDLPLLAVFGAVARSGSFTAAGRELGVSKSVVSDQVRTLEERCGVRLIERSTRRLKLTQVGEGILSIASRVAAAGRDIDSILEEHRDAPVGMLRIATTHDLSERFVAPTVARLARLHPQLRADIVSDDGPADLIKGGFDLAVRLGAPLDSQLVMRKLGAFDEALYASPALADTFSHVTRPRDLAGAPWVRHSLLPKLDVWTFRGPRRDVDEIGVTVRAQANTGDGVRALLLGGAGFGVLPTYQATHDVRRGALVRVCPEWIWRGVTLYAVFPSAKRQPKRVELMLAALENAVVREGLA
jgi:DNA-binding transcriptional LysR family regulator